MRELAIVVIAAGVYFGGREVVQGSERAALRNAGRITDFEATFGLDLEHGVQDLVLGNSVLRALGNVSYVWLHWPLLIVVLAVLFVRDQRRYRQLRNAMCASGAIGLLLFTAVPTAPPRFLPGYTGTVSDAARTHYLSIPLGWTNPFASFPSFHVGWTLIACLAVARSMPGFHSTIALLAPAVLVGVAVITTGNHYLVDAIVGAALSVGAYWTFSRREQRTVAYERVGTSN